MLLLEEPYSLLGLAKELSGRKKRLARTPGIKSSERELEVLYYGVLGRRDNFDSPKRKRI